MRLDGLELRIPSPVVNVAVAAAMFGIARAPLAMHVDLSGRPAIAALVAAAGVGIAVAGVWVFRRARTTVHPHHPDGAYCQRVRRWI